MPNPDRVTSWDTNRRADKLFGPKGGVAVWVRNDDHEVGLGPRCAIRHGSDDPYKAAIALAELLLGVDQLTESLCQMHGWDRETMGKMVVDAADRLRPHLQSATRIKPATPKEP